MKDWIEIKFWQIAIGVIKAGYGYRCEDFEPDCSCCHAYKTIDWINGHIILIKS